MAAKRVKMFVIQDGPGMLEMQFSDYNPQGHIVEFQVEETSGMAANGKLCVMVGGRKGLHCQVTGSDRMERRMVDVRGWDIPAGARLIRVRSGMWPFEGWYEPRSRKGFLREAQGFRNGVPPPDFLKKLGVA